MKSKIIAKNISVFKDVEEFLLEIQLDDLSVFEMSVTQDVFEKCSLGDIITIESEELERQKEGEEMIQSLHQGE